MAARPREYIYCWYQRNGVRKKATQLVRTARYKLYASGQFYDVKSDPLEELPIPRDALPSAARKAHTMLGEALARHRRVPTIADPIQRAKRRAGGRHKKK